MRLGNAKLKKIFFSFVIALTFHYLCINFAINIGGKIICTCTKSYRVLVRSVQSPCTVRTKFLYQQYKGFVLNP